MYLSSINPFLKLNPVWSDKEFLKNDDMMEFHRSFPGYNPTPLISLPALASVLGVKEIWVKDESKRFGIKAFKALGASYAIFRFIKTKWESEFGEEFRAEDFLDQDKMKKFGNLTFCAATDGNHGKAVAWTAKKINQKAKIYMPSNTVKARIDNIECEGADVVLIEGTFDDCVTRCAEDALKNNWYAISDTAYTGYFDIPGWILLGYTTIFKEMEERLNLIPEPEIDYVFLQAGVGGLAAAGTSYYSIRYGEHRPKLVCVEPIDSDCFLESIRFGNGASLPTKGKQESIMAGLNCGIPSPLAWPIIKDGMHFFIAIPDSYAEKAMRVFYNPFSNDPQIISGESGCAGLAALMALCDKNQISEFRERMGLNSNSRILLINTEGDTDPENFKRIIENN
jgi:diaminopropionate ammonia-lyase